MSNWRRVESEIKDDEVFFLLEKIVRIPSHRDAVDGERKVAEVIASYLKGNGIESKVETIGKGVNIICKIGSLNTRASSMMFNGHLDTVPVGNMSVPPFEALTKNGFLFGRGACDMKGGVASMASALVALKRSGVNLKGTLVFAGVSGEESGSPGTRRLVQHGPKTDCAIVGEPTSLRIAVASKGMAYARILVRGKSAHGSAPWEGVNAIEKAAKIVTRLHQKLPDVLRKKAHRLLGPPTFNVGVIRAGTQPNIVPDQCVAMIDRRIVPGENLSDLKAEFESVIDEVRKEDSQVNADVTIDELLMPTMDTPLETPFVRCLRDSVEIIHGRAELIGLSGSTDGAFLAEGGVPSVVFGPGPLEKAHSADEQIRLRDIIEATKIYACTALRYLF